MQTQQANTRKTSSLVKKYLKQQFGIKASVRTEKYAGGSSMRVEYQLGPDSKEVEAHLKQLQHGHFDGMVDMYNFENKPAFVVDGYELETFQFVFVEQHIPDEVWYRMAKALSDTYNFGKIPKLESPEQMQQTFSERLGMAWDWQQLAYQSFRKRNFATQDPEQIEFKEVKSYGSDDALVYELNGQTYRTDEPVKVGNKPQPPKEPTKVDDVEVVDYSEKAIAVTGNTKPIKETLKSMGGRFNPRLTCGPGWIFPKTRQSEVQDALSL